MGLTGTKSIRYTGYMKYGKALEKRKKEIIAAIGKCEKCHVQRDVLTIDHIIPIALLLEMGYLKEETYDEDNFMVMCLICQHQKSRRLDFSNPKTKPLLLKYLERV